MLKIDLDVDQTNTVLKALSALPYSEVAGIIHTIKVQGDSQVAGTDKPKVTAESKGDEPEPQQLNG
jgi:hypothetical protein